MRVNRRSTNLQAAEASYENFSDDVELEPVDDASYEDLDILRKYLAGHIAAYVEEHL